MRAPAQPGGGPKRGVRALRWVAGAGNLTARLRGARSGRGGRLRRRSRIPTSGSLASVPDRRKGRCLSHRCLHKLHVGLACLGTRQKKGAVPVPCLSHPDLGLACLGTRQKERGGPGHGQPSAGPSGSTAARLASAAAVEPCGSAGLPARFPAQPFVHGGRRLGDTPPEAKAVELVDLLIGEARVVRGRGAGVSLDTSGGQAVPKQADPRRGHKPRQPPCKGRPT